MRSNLQSDNSAPLAYAELPSLRILVINDDHGVSQLLKIMLEMDGHIVITTDRGAKGVELAAMGPDLIICDIRMPGLDGFGVVTALKKNPLTREIPFLFMTGSVDENDMRRGVALGADDCLSMPFAKKDLAAAIFASCQKPSRRSPQVRFGSDTGLAGVGAPLLATCVRVENLRLIA